jgi:hypothetical protein
MFYEWRQRVEKPYRFMHEVKRLLIVVPTRFVCRSLSAVFLKQAVDELLAKGLATPFVINALVKIESRVCILFDRSDEASWMESECKAS